MAPELARAFTPLQLAVGRYLAYGLLSLAMAWPRRRSLLAGLDRLVALGLPVLVGASRKTFLGRLLAAPDGQVRPVEGREAATLAISVLAAQAGAWGVRVHDPVQSLDAIATVAAVQAARRAGGGERA